MPLFTTYLLPVQALKYLMQDFYFDLFVYINPRTVVPVIRKQQ